jgi:type I restriction enzyme S subunit
MRGEWQSVTLAEICREVRYGFTASATQTQTDTHFLRVTDIAKGFVNWAEVPFCESRKGDGSIY